MEFINGLKKAQMLNKDCDYILLDLEGFLCITNRFYRFSIDDEQLEYLNNVLDNILKCDNEAKIMVCAYKDELVDNEQKTFIYADSILISTSISKESIIDIFNEGLDEFSPSDISTYEEISEIDKNEMMYITNNGTIKTMAEVLKETEIKNIKIIYWD
ncbi:hypothetical protein KHQ81_08415 [Mycoplasmatota bacterium]|nr:hypothetical protein KHQ81_08415 [Mycoplasmatota bacterium]